MAEFDNGIDALLGLIKSQTMEIYTCLQGSIVSYKDGKATVSPVGSRRFDDGDEMPYPHIFDVPVLWPSFAGGTAFIKGPVRAGDKCLLVFSQSAIDGTDDRRTHDLTDAHAIMCDLGSASGKASNNDSLMMAFGESFLKIGENGDIEISSTGSLKIVAPNGIEAISPATHFAGSVASDGGLSSKMDMKADGGISAIGNINSDSDVIAKGISTVNHTHSGVQSGGASTGKPNK